MKKTASIFLALVMLFSCFAGVPAKAQAASVNGADIVAYAAKYDGYPYVWGTHGPNSFDCSGFVHYVYAHFGIELPYSSSEYWNNPKKYGTVVGEDSVANAQPGDVISWNGHVAIYIGNNHTVEAVGSKWGVVYNYPLSYHSNKHYRVIRIFGVTSTEPVIEVDIEDTVTEGIPKGWYTDEYDGTNYY